MNSGVRERTLTDGNRAELICDGDDCFEAVWEAIGAATRRVWLEMYIFEPDRVGERTLERLTAAAGRGCDVILIYDWFGSIHVKEGFFDPLKRAGGRVVAYNPLWPPRALKRDLRRLKRRDHRKILLVDDRVGFCGGINIGVEYAGKRYGTGLFYDTMLRLEGPCVAELARLFVQSLTEASTIRRDPISRPAPLPDGIGIEVLGHHPSSPTDAGSYNMRVHQMITSAERCYLTTPYFVPNSRLESALFRAAANGADVRIITAGRSDIPVARMVGRHLYGAYLRRGIAIYELQTPTLHAKNVCVDEAVSIVGSYNFDATADRHGLEVGVVVEDAALAALLKNEFLANMERSREMTLSAWKGRPPLRRSVDRLFYKLAGLI